ncbi:hypothetical protein BX666DRAFT_1982128 [Dichotomocladium elegans]|nr:hypothetical protein BX666DRAFT_1982128 [Dichotomocladium elegans]
MANIQHDPDDTSQRLSARDQIISPSSNITAAVSASTSLGDPSVPITATIATSELRHRHMMMPTTRSISEPASPLHSKSDEFYECNICFDTATHPVLTLCGHLFCWTCLAQWLNAQARNPTCPVCKAGCGEDKVIPVYGRGRDEKDPRKDPAIPSRPAGQRPPALRDPGYSTSFFNRPFRGFYRQHGNAGMSLSPTAGLFPFPFGIGMVSQKVRAQVK